MKRLPRRRNGKPKQVNALKNSGDELLETRTTNEGLVRHCQLLPRRRFPLYIAARAQLLPKSIYDDQLPFVTRSEFLSKLNNRRKYCNCSIDCILQAEAPKYFLHLILNVFELARCARIYIASSVSSRVRVIAYTVFLHMLTFLGRAYSD